MNECGDSRQRFLGVVCPVTAGPGNMKLLSPFISWVMVSIFVWGVLLAIRPDNLNTSGGFLWGVSITIFAIADVVSLITIIKRAAH
jgi:hypothetical protein